MSLRIHHVFDGSETAAGSVRPLLRGLIHQLESRGFGGTSAHAVEDSREYVIDATRKADIVHIHACSFQALIGAARLAERLHKPFVVSAGGELDSAAIRRCPRGVRWRGKFHARRLVRKAAAVLAQNETEASALRQRYAREVTNLPYGFSADENSVKVDESVAHSPPAPQGRCALMLSDFAPHTGCAALLKAFAELGPDTNDWHIVIAGSGENNYCKMLEAAIRRKGGDDRVILSRIDNECGRRAWLARADVLVAPSFEPGPATSILQAAAGGVPVMASLQVLPDSLSGSVVACDASRAGIREGLRRIIRMDDTARLELANRAKLVVSGELSWGDLADRYVSLYNSIA